MGSHVTGSSGRHWRHHQLCFYGRTGSVPFFVWCKVQSLHPIFSSTNAKCDKSYLSSWFQLFDSTIIVVGFVVDVAFRGLAQDIGSLVIVLRLWRLAKISEELVLGAAERMDLLERRIDHLQDENSHLKAQLGFESAGE